MAAFLDNPQAEEIHIQVLNVVPQIDSQPYSARVDFVKSYVVPGAAADSPTEPNGTLDGKYSIHPARQSSE